MDYLAALLLVYASLMLVIHVTSWKLAEHWYGGVSWVKRWLPLDRVVRGEAVFWVLALLAWPLWPPGAFRIIIAIFAVIHLAVWVVVDARRNSGPLLGNWPVRKIARALGTFDFMEAFVLAGIIWVTARRLL